MTTLIIWIVLAVPRDVCFSELKTAREKAQADYSAAAGFEQIEKTRAALNALAPLPGPKGPLLTIAKPKPDEFGPCYTVFSSSAALALVK